MNFGALVRRFAPTPSTVAIAEASGQSVITLALTRNWKVAMSLISEKLDVAHVKRRELVEARRALLLAAVEGDDSANAKLRKVENDLADHDRHIARLQDARVLAEERDEAEQAAAAAAERVRAVAAWEAGNEEMIQLAESADALAAKLAAVTIELAAKADTQASTTPKKISDHDRGASPLGSGRVMVAVQMQLAENGLRWAWQGPLPWKDRPSAASVVRTGIDWVRGEIARADRRNNVT